MMKWQDCKSMAWTTVVVVIAALCFVMAERAEAYTPSVALIEKGRKYHDLNKHKPQYQTKGTWARWLMAVGHTVPGYGHLTPMTEADCRPRVSRWGGWKPFCDALKALEAVNQVIPPPQEEEQQPAQQDPPADPQQAAADCKAELRYDYSVSDATVEFEEGDYIRFEFALTTDCLVTNAAQSTIVIEGFEELVAQASSYHYSSDKDGWDFTCEYPGYPGECVLTAVPENNWRVENLSYTAGVAIWFNDENNDVVNLNREGTIGLKDLGHTDNSGRYYFNDHQTAEIDWFVENDDQNWFILSYDGRSKNAVMKSLGAVETPSRPQVSNCAGGHVNFKTQYIGPAWGSKENQVDDRIFCGGTDNEQAVNPVINPGAKHTIYTGDDADCTHGWGRIRYWFEEDNPGLKKKWLRTYNYDKYTFNSEVKVCH